MLEDPTSARSKARAGLKPLADAHHVSWTRNAFRQLKLIGPGAAITYLLGTVDKFEAVLLGGDGSFGSKVALVAFGNALAMVILFLYILFLMYQRGERLDWRTWRQSGSLSTIIPVGLLVTFSYPWHKAESKQVLTTTIIIGWLLHVIVLGKWTDLGYIRGLVGASGLYVLVFGLLALIPAPRRQR
ncbi:hypothetical protein AN958_06307 [Leucoagaricus sp. SymC.cos]|nr:hypothetical protein AN958_06307 [Leucoagaricus sp. SymC.cos]